MQIDTLVMLIADQNGGKSNQIRSIFEEHELYNEYGGYPPATPIRSRYEVAPDVELYVRLSSWHEKNANYATAKADIAHHRRLPRRRFKVLVPAQVTATKNLMAGEDLLMQLMQDFDVRRAYAIWLDPDRQGRNPPHVNGRNNFVLSPKFAAFMSQRRELSALSIDSLALHPSASPTTNSINARLICDFLFRT